VLGGQWIGVPTHIFVLDGGLKLIVFAHHQGVTDALQHQLLEPRGVAFVSERRTCWRAGLWARHLPFAR
jgi:hypothetical protein